MEDLAYFEAKFGQVQFANRRCKNGFECQPRCGATRRRNHFNEIQSKRHCSVILKHISTTTQWNANEVEDEFSLDDGGMTRHGWNVAPRKRGKNVRSIVAQPTVWAINDFRPSFVTYSMNKKKRWLLPEQLKEEIELEKETRDKNWDTKVDLTVVERNVGSSNDRLHPDVTEVISTAIKKPESRRRRRHKRTFAWSTDLLGLSQNDKKDETVASDETKPGITYEVCYPRTSGPFLSCTNTAQLLYSKDKKNRRQKKQKLQDDSLELESEWNDITNEEEASVFVKEKTPISIASWIIRPTDKASVYTRNMGTTPTSAPKRPGSKKGKVIHLPKPVPHVEEENLRNVEVTKSADNYFNKVIESEASTTFVVCTSLSSLLDLNAKFNGKNTSSFLNAVVTKSRSQPVRYAFQMARQVPSQQETGKCALAYLVLEVLNDPMKCSSKNSCFYYGDFCVCNDKLDVKGKMVLLVQDEKMQDFAVKWSENVKDILFQRKSSTKILSLKAVFHIASNAFLKILQPIERNEETQKKISKQTKPKQNVVGRASSLLGFSVTTVDRNSIFNETKDGSNDESHEIIVNRTPRDFCQICWTSLSNANGEYGATAMVKCSHWFCHDCWRQHLITSARGVITQEIRCPGYDCDVIIDVVTMMSLLPGYIISQHQARLNIIAINRSNEFHICPKCSKTNKVANSVSAKFLKKPTPLSCTCGTWWCSHCKEEPHWPASCSEAEFYRQEVKNVESLSVEVSGKRCPECHTKIEKFGGCKMMLCVCGFEFCWNCMRSFYECGYQCGWEPGMELIQDETWKLKSKDVEKTEAVLLAHQETQLFKLPRNSARRLNHCRKKADKVAAATLRGRDYTRADRHKLTREIEAKLLEVNEHCNALHYIMSFLIVSRGCQTRGHHSRTKLERFEIRFRSALCNIEHSLFSETSVNRTSLERLLEKKVSTSKTILRDLSFYINKLPK